MKHLHFSLAVMAIIIFSLNTLAQAPQTMHFQGMLKDGSGTAMNETKSMEFRIYYAETGTTPIWTEEHNTVEISEGLFSVILGQTNPISAAFFYQYSSLFITFVVDSEEMTPRQELQTVPYSFYTSLAEEANLAESATYATNAVNAQKLNNIPYSGFVQQDAFENANISGTMTANAFVGDGSGLTNIAGDWMESGNYTYNENDSIGIGLVNPTERLDVNGKIAINNMQTIYNADAEAGLTGSLIIGNGGENLTNSYDYQGFYNTLVGIGTGESCYKAHSNTAIGHNALHNNSNGSSNTAIGSKALSYNTGSSNTACGSSTLFFNTSGHDNTAMGNNALLDNTSGNSNTAIGTQALYSNTSGNSNSANGSGSLNNNTTGNSNIAIGVRALYSNTTISNLVAIGDSALYNNGIGASHWFYEGEANVAIGSKALFSNTKGKANTAIGMESLCSNTQGNWNTAVGGYSLNYNTTGQANSAFGVNALRNNTTGNNNTANGYSSLYINTSGSHNTACGYKALYDNTTGESNVANGYQALNKNTSGNKNTANGSEALYKNISGEMNAASGFQALYNNTYGDFNTASGYLSLYYNSTGNYNTALGTEAMKFNYTGQFNTAVGYVAMRGLTSGSYNTALGHYSYFSGDYTNSTALGDGAIIDGDNQVRIGHNVSSIGGWVAWTNLSDGRYKTDVQENVPGLDFIKQLRPVTYHFDAQKLNNAKNLPEEYLNDPAIKDASAKFSSMTFSGFIAQEVEAVANNLNFNFSGVDKPETPEGTYGLRYAEFVVPLVKAVQEQQEIIENQNTTIEQLIQRIEKLEQSK